MKVKHDTRSYIVGEKSDHTEADFYLFSLKQTHGMREWGSKKGEDGVRGASRSWPR